MGASPPPASPSLTPPALPKSPPFVRTASSVTTKIASRGRLQTPSTFQNRAGPPSAPSPAPGHGHAPCRAYLCPAPCRAYSGPAPAAGPNGLPLAPQGGSGAAPPLHVNKRAAAGADWLRRAARVPPSAGRGGGWP